MAAALAKGGADALFELLHAADLVGNLHDRAAFSFAGLKCP